MTKRVTQPKKPQEPAEPAPPRWLSRIVEHGDADPRTLRANPQNWRTHPRAQAQGLAAVLDEVGWVGQVIVNRRSGRLLDGHLRTELAVQRGEASIPVSYVDLSDDEERLVLATLDPLAALADADAGKLAAILQELGGAFEGPALEELLREIAAENGITAPEPPPAPGGESAGPGAPPAEPITRRGDLILLGRHRLLCGDATDAADVDRVLDGAKADAVITDPPYAIYGSSTGVAADITDDKMVRPFFREILRAIAANLKPFGHFYVCCDWRSWASWWEVAKGTGLAIKNMIVWDKAGAGLGSNYANTHELLCFGSYLEMRERMTQKMAGIRSVFAPNVWTFNRVKAAGTDGGREHNAQKPLELIAQAMNYSTDAGDLVLDLFGGAGTTLLAAEDTGRRCAMLEIEPGYCDVIVARWERATGAFAQRPPREEPQ